MSEIGFINWIEEVKLRIKRKNQILFSKSSQYLQDLTNLINEQNHQTLIVWALDLAEETIEKLEVKYPNEERPRKTLEMTKLWATGKIKMLEAKQEILNCHAIAKEITIKEDIALCHAIGQACSVVHIKTHAIGFPIYDLTAIIYKYGIDNCKEYIEKRMQEYINKINYWKINYQNYLETWAEFITK